MSIERPGDASPAIEVSAIVSGRVAVHASPAVPVEDAGAPDAEAIDFVRFCYRRRAVAWPDLYDEMCYVAARGDYRGLSYEQLEGLGIRLALAALPRLAEVAARVIAEERAPTPTSAVA